MTDGIPIEVHVRPDSLLGKLKAAESERDEADRKVGQLMRMKRQGEANDLRDADAWRHLLRLAPMEESDEYQKPLSVTYEQLLKIAEQYKRNVPE